MTIWRAKMNSRRPDVDPDAHWDGARKYAREKSVVGVGWGHARRDNAPFDEVIAAIESRSGRWAVTRLAKQVQDGDLIWTRDRGGDYWLGRVDGPWRYDDSEEARKWDLNNIRDCAWLTEPMRELPILAV
jgi:hypothetical protein